jgi:CASC3/Barentsz eIF4AIII binding
MPAPVLPKLSASTVNQSATRKPCATVTKKKRAVRRRGRANDDLDSDHDVGRQFSTDSGSDHDNLSSVDSATDDSDIESASDGIPNDRAHLSASRNTKSSVTAVQVGGSSLTDGVAFFFSPSGNWSDMVAGENANGSPDLPVIELSNFKARLTAPNDSSRNHKKAIKLARSSVARAKIPSSPPANDDIMSNFKHNSVALDQQQSHLLSSQSTEHGARQAYQHRLETDPSYVPTIGNFWGHDDRLIDADLRSLSGWWRGRERGRGRGGGFAMRGRRGFQGAPLNAGSDGKVPPIDRPWTHDAFEDMKRREEKRRAVIKQQKASHHVGKGGFPSGGNINPPLRREAPVPATAHTLSVPATHVRFPMKPELMWTKQHEAFLYFDSSLKARSKQRSGIRVKLPGLQSFVVRSLLSRTHRSTSAFDLREGSEGGDRFLVVCLPKRAGKEREEDRGDPTTEPSIEAFTVKLHMSRSDMFPEPINLHVEIPKLPVSQPSTPVQPPVMLQLGQLNLQPQPSDPERRAKTEQAVLRRPSIEVDNEVPDDSSTEERLALPALRTTLTPPPQVPMTQLSPAFSSPYGYAPTLPLGVAMNQHGMPYEVATGRPVYLQPGTLYDPRPLMHSHIAPPGTPGHLPHHSSVTSPDFLPQPPYTAVNGFIDPLTGSFNFLFPRQTSRIEIRAPTEEPGKPAKHTSRILSSLRTTAPAFQPSQSSENLENGYPQSSHSDTGASLYENTNTDVSVEDVGMIAYPAYQQPYYHMELCDYSRYMNLSQYDMYNADQHAIHGAVYY